MTTFDRLPPTCEIIEEGIQQRDTAIIELYDELKKCLEVAALCGNFDDSEATRQNLFLKKYEDFVQITRDIYGR